MDRREAARTIYQEAFTKGNLDILDRFVAPDYVNHNRPPGAASGLAGLKAIMTRLREAFPDLGYEVEDIIVDGDYVAIRATMKGTQATTLDGQKPTGRRFSVPSLAMLRFRGDMVVERWGLHDVDAMRAQLAVGTQPAGSQ